MATDLHSPAPRFSPPALDERFDDEPLRAGVPSTANRGDAALYERPQFRHGTIVSRTWYEIALNPARWSAGHWALLTLLGTVLADVMVFAYASNLLGIDRKFEIEMWLLTAGIAGFATITLALWGIFFKSARGAAVFALVLAIPIGAPPAWLVGNTLLQLVLNNGVLPVAPPLW